MTLLITSVLIITIIGLVCGLTLYFVSRKFEYKESERVMQILNILPGVNCGGCGYTGCEAFAKALDNSVEADFPHLKCPVAGNKVMMQIADILGYEFAEKEKEIAVIKCNGTIENTIRNNVYDGLKSCALANQTFIGQGACPFGCLGLGDCLRVCNFGAITIDEKKGIPVFNPEKCSACGACIKACPRHLIELRSKNNDMVFVACMNHEKGGVAKKHCKVACIGCGKCTKIDEKITLTDNLAYIPNDANFAKNSKELIDCCPSKSIVSLGIIKK